MSTKYVGPDVFRWPRLKESGRNAMVETWKDEMFAEFPTRQAVRIHIGKRLALIKWEQGYGNFRRWFDEQQGFEFGWRSAEKYMREALDHYKTNTNNSSQPLEPKTDEVHEKTAEQKAKFDSYSYAFILYDLTPEEKQRLKNLRKTEERVKAHAAVIKALQPWLTGERDVTHPA
jgi:hypothetical protein